MAFRREPHRLEERYLYGVTEAWWYEEETVMSLCVVTPETIVAVVVEIPWGRIEAALKRAKAAREAREETELKATASTARNEVMKHEMSAHIAIARGILCDAEDAQEGARVEMTPGRVDALRQTCDDAEETHRLTARLAELVRLAREVRRVPVGGRHSVSEIRAAEAALDRWLAEHGGEL